MVPAWLHTLAIASLIIGFACAVIIAVDERKRPQHMWIMALVWPIVALFGSLPALWAYFTFGRGPAPDQHRHHGHHHHNDDTPFAVKVAKGTCHCGSGCALGDIIAEWLLFFVPVIAVWFGWKSVFGDKIFAAWILDFILAFGFGIFFQYFSIKPMRDVSPGQALIDAIKADTLSLLSWQIGMYGFMAIAHFWIFAQLLHVPLEANSPEFWLMMQIAMWCGFVTAYPVNWMLIRVGVKEAM